MARNHVQCLVLALEALGYQQGRARNRENQLRKWDATTSVH